MKLLLFDIDGTILLTGGAGRVAFERVFEELFGIRDAWKDLRPDGKIDPRIIEELAQKNLNRNLTSDEYMQVFERYLKYFEEELPKSKNFKLMPGIVNLLQELHKREDIFLGIATGNFEKPARHKLRQAGCHHYFSFGGFADGARDRIEMTGRAIQKGHEHAGRQIDTANIFVIGDSIHDVQAAQAHQVKSLAVATGSTTRQELAAYGPDVLLEDLSQIDSFLNIIDAIL